MDARVTLDIGACVRKTLCLVQGSEGTKAWRHESVNPYLLSIPLSVLSSLSTYYVCSPCALRPRNFDGLRNRFIAPPSELPGFSRYLLVAPVSITWRAIASLESSYPTLAFYLFYLFSCLLFTSALYECCELPICWILYEHFADDSFAAWKRKNKSLKNALEEGFCLVQFLTCEKTPRSQQ